MSELEQIAAQLRALSADGNHPQRLAADMMREIQSLGMQVAHVSHLRHLPGLVESSEALLAAQRATGEAAQLLAALRSGAEDFADHLVASSSPQSLGGPTPGPASTSAPKRPPPTPEAPISTRSLTDVRAHLGLINPNQGAWWDLRKRYNNNCGSVAANVFDFLSGAPAHRAAKNTLTDDEMDARTGLRTTVVAGPDEIERILRASGPGSHAVIGILRSRGNGHWFNAYFDGAHVYTIEGQRRGGIISGFPPSHETTVTQWDMSL